MTGFAFIWHWFWNRLTWRGKLAIFAAVAFLALAIYVGYLTNRARKAEQRTKEAIATDSTIRLDEAKQNVNRASENINAVKNANYSNLSNDELRERIINAARKQK